LPTPTISVVYVEIFEGEDFGQVDIISCAFDKGIEVENIITS